MSIFIKSEIEANRLGSNIRVARKRRKLSLVELALKANISKSVLGRIEQGDPSVGIGKVLNVLEALGLLDGLSDLVSPELDRAQVLKDVQALREGTERSKKTKLVRFIG